MLARSKLPLTTWFWAMYLLTQQKNAISTLELMHQPAISCPSAWRVKHKVLQVMLDRDAERQPTGVIKIDDACWGGACHGHTQGRGSPNKTAFAAGLPKNLEGHPTALRLSVAPALRKRELAAWTQPFIHAHTFVFCDGLDWFRGVAAARVKHQPVARGGG